MPELSNTVALVTGASRGVGKGVAMGLGEAGATVYVTGRDRVMLDQTAREVDQQGGTGIAVRCDHRDDQAVEAVFEQIRRDHGRLDILVNNVWGGYENMVENGDDS